MPTAHFVKEKSEVLPRHRVTMVVRPEPRENTLSTGGIDTLDSHRVSFCGGFVSKPTRVVSFVETIKDPVLHPFPKDSCAVILVAVSV